MKEINMKIIRVKKALLLMSILTVVFIHCQGQISKSKGKLIVEYKYETTFMNGRKGEYNFHFIIDSAISISYNKRTFYQFSFSDTADVSGYVNYNRSKNSLDFIAENFKSKNPFCQSKTIQTIFIFNNSKTIQICSLGILGSNIILISRKLSEHSNYNYEISIIRKSPMPSENRVIKEMFFKKDIYPALISIDDPVLERKVYLKALVHNFN
jgi:hypothetical protein